ncbi:GDSL-type esterase/lipase family protein [Christiangramia aquimixticola]|uniref:GDSL-type esterase/lipase family protein n=1 Tax=Christiangramia aquimixticola TaxID=1697558 RepID=UPI003AA9E084
MQDAAELKYYQKANKKITDSLKNPEVVFMGDSITEGWVSLDPDFFHSNNYVGRGIGGQTSFQMLLRFMLDVVALCPKAVVILAGTNDIAENSSNYNSTHTLNNIKAMTAIATAHNISVILCSLLPVDDYPWNPGLNPIPKIAELNKELKELSEKQDFIFADLFSATVNEHYALKSEYSEDGVHPTLKGYKTMQPEIQEAIRKCLSL